MYKLPNISYMNQLVLSKELFSKRKEGITIK